MAVTTRHGRELTDADLDALAAEAERGFEPSTLRLRRGRPFLDAASAEPAPKMSVRVPARLRDRAVARASSEGRTISEVLRSLLEAYAAEDDAPAR